MAGNAKCEGTGGRQLVLAGGSRPRLVNGRPSSWTAAMGTRFAEVLAETCNR